MENNSQVPQAPDETRPVKEWTQEEVQTWLQKKGWIDCGKKFLGATGSDLLALPIEEYQQILGDIPGRVVCAAIHARASARQGKNSIDLHRTYFLLFWQI